MATSDQITAMQLQHKQTWERLFSILKSTRIGGAEACHQLAELPIDKRSEYLEQVWGRTALIKCESILTQIASVEEQLARETQ